MKASGSSMARREEDGEVGEASGSQGRKLGSLYDVEMVLRVRLRAEVDGGGRVHRRGALGRETAVAVGFLGSRRKRRGGSRRGA